MIPAGMILPVLRAKQVQPEEGAAMARDLYAGLKTVEDRDYIDGLVQHFVREWNAQHYRASELVPEGITS